MPTPEEWFKRMRRAADNPEETEKLTKEPRSKRNHKECPPNDQRPETRKDWLREWEETQDNA